MHIYVYIYTHTHTYKDSKHANAIIYNNDDNTMYMYMYYVLCICICICTYVCVSFLNGGVSPTSPLMYIICIRVTMRIHMRIHMANTLHVIFACCPFACVMKQESCVFPQSGGRPVIVLSSR